MEEAVAEAVVAEAPGAIVLKGILAAILQQQLKPNNNKEAESSGVKVEVAVIEDATAKQLTTSKAGNSNGKTRRICQQKIDEQQLQ